ncbi:MAG: hypothetical protein CVU26_02495 [Betaproteobacteria bacterium HGW-Betaproteobacteria-2]|nr:MAG: hypothetical protein CVU26_02495 [Betaproteobacteria bacterium HGW-Betaproteobacteria-2]PKP58319.1 MAG: hypothetical protein CVT91_08775 [Candidatus Atribacteria bacterium HGW-Atribacteria-1]
MRAIKAIVKPPPDIKVDEDGKLDPATMSRKMRRAYERELARGTFNTQPMDKPKPCLLLEPLTQSKG